LFESSFGVTVGFQIVGTPVNSIAEGKIGASRLHTASRNGGNCLIARVAIFGQRLSPH
jgi:hypothetical protein